MAEEEIAEALAGHDVEPELDAADVVLVDSERAHIAAAPSAKVRAWRRGRAHAKLRAGKTLSADTMRCLQDAQAMHADAIDLHRSAIAKHKAAMGAVDDMMDRAGVADSATDPQVQKSDGDQVDEGSRAALAHRQRQADVLRLARAH
jgi:hypothetical protein